MRPSVRDSFLAQFLSNRLWEFHQIYNLSAVGDTDEPITFWGQKVKGQGHGEILRRLIDGSPSKTI